MITCPRCAGDGYIDYTCPHCNGSGEGLADGTRCGYCPKSEGVIRDTCDVCNGKCKVLAPPFKINKGINEYLKVEEVAEEQLCLSIVDDNDEVYEEQILISIDNFLKVAEKVKLNS